MIQDLGRYNLLCKIGEGGMGSVYLARQKNLHRFCAIKVINPLHAGTPALAERFLREARTAATVSHPNLVNVFDCDQYDSQSFIAMEYIEGLNLGEALRLHGKLPLPLALHWLDQASTALQHVHEKGIIHRDIKPDNMMIDSDAHLKITDLGLARNDADTDERVTMSGIGMGTPHYMSPEQINNAKKADARADIYSLGISFYHMLAGQPPYVRESAADVFVAHLQEPLPLLDWPDDPALGRELDQFIGWMAAKSREYRFQTVKDLRDELRSWLERFPLDEESQRYCDKLSLKNRNIEGLLEKNGIDRKLLDSDLNHKTARVPTTPPPVAPSRSNAWMLAAAVVVVAAISAWMLVSKKSGGEKTPTPAVPTGSLLVTTEPKNAFVIFDGKSRTSENGAVSFEEVAPGKYPVEITLPGYRSAQGEIEITEDNVVKQHFALQRIPGTARVESIPPGADVVVNGNVIGKTPYVIPGGDGEEVKCELRLRGYEDAMRKLTLKEQPEVVRIQLAMRAPIAPRPAPFGTQTGGGAPLAPRSLVRVERKELGEAARQWVDQARQSRGQPEGRAALQRKVEMFFQNKGVPPQDAANVAAAILKNMSEAMGPGAAPGEIFHHIMQAVEPFREALGLQGDPPQPPNDMQPGGPPNGNPPGGQRPPQRP